MSMRAVQGLEVRRQLNAENGRIPVVFILAHTGDDAVERGAAGSLRKPFGEDKTPRYDQACDWTAGRNDNWMGYASRCSVGRRMDVLRGGLPSWMDWRVRLRVRDGADHPLQHCTEYR
jgi:CheY-like chemotaxis protein